MMALEMKLLMLKLFMLLQLWESICSVITLFMLSFSKMHSFIVWIAVALMFSLSIALLHSIQCSTFLKRRMRQAEASYQYTKMLLQLLNILFEFMITG